MAPLQSPSALVNPLATGNALAVARYPQPVFSINMPQRVNNPVGEGISSQPPRLISSNWRSFPTGAYNAITDVPGIQVGHRTISRQTSPKIQTGVTAIVPNAALLASSNNPVQPANLATTGFRAAAVTLNGNGELTGLGPITTAGILNSPIILTNTYAVGAAHEGVFRWFAQHYPGQWGGQLPVVGECWDGVFNTIETPVLTPEDTVAAMEAAQSGPLAQGRTGAGSGMRSFEMRSGIGSASRKVMLNGREYTIGVLVNSNHSRLPHLSPLLRMALENYWGKPLEAVRNNDNRDRALRNATPASNSATGGFPGTRQGSIMVIIATDLPLDSQALRQVAERAGLGIGNTGSTMSTTSGDFALAFSTANPLQLGQTAPDLLPAASVVHPDALSPVFQATVEAVTEAQLNAIVAAHTPASR
jgi:D-aminopeptidase